VARPSAIRKLQMTHFSRKVILNVGARDGSALSPATGVLVFWRLCQAGRNSRKRTIHYLSRLCRGGRRGFGAYALPIAVLYITQGSFVSPALVDGVWDKIDRVYLMKNVCGPQPSACQ
jgi:hypothetical protein